MGDRRRAAHAPRLGDPIATDIAFAIGILTLLGKRVPPPLRVLLLALAVIDDLGAVGVIALFYSSRLSGNGLLIALAAIGAILLLQKVGVRAKWIYLLPALVVWAGVESSGIHATLAGVAIGALTPVRAPPEQRSPSEQLIQALHPWVAFGILPLFALANAGVSLTGPALDGASWRVVTATSLGLLLGKPLGILLACGLVIRTGLGSLPTGLSWRHLCVLGVVAGVGFTMALFVAQLAFGGADAAPLLAAAKLGVLLGSAGAAMGGLAAGKLLLGARS